MGEYVVYGKPEGTLEAAKQAIMPHFYGEIDRLDVIFDRHVRPAIEDAVRAALMKAAKLAGSPYLSQVALASAIRDLIPPHPTLAAIEKFNAANEKNKGIIEQPQPMEKTHDRDTRESNRE